MRRENRCERRSCYRLLTGRDANTARPDSNRKARSQGHVLNGPPKAKALLLG